MDKYESLDIVLEILKRLIDKGELSERMNEALYLKYKNNEAIEDLLHYVARGLELRVYEGDRVLYLCPETGSNVFGWANDDLLLLIYPVQKLTSSVVPKLLDMVSKKTTVFN